jgi:hypothetical protein
MALKKLLLAGVAPAQTVETNTGAEINLTATMWEVDSTQVSPLANAQYPLRATEKI